MIQKFWLNNFFNDPRRNAILQDIQFSLFDLNW